MGTHAAAGAYVLRVTPSCSLPLGLSVRSGLLAVLFGSLVLHGKNFSGFGVHGTSVMLFVSGTEMSKDHTETSLSFSSSKK